MTLKPAHADSNAGGDRSGERRAEEHTCRPREPDRTISTIQRPTHERAVEPRHRSSIEGAAPARDVRTVIGALEHQSATSRGFELGTYSRWRTILYRPER